MLVRLVSTFFCFALGCLSTITDAFAEESPAVREFYYLNTSIKTRIESFVFSGDFWTGPVLGFGTDVFARPGAYTMFEFNPKDRAGSRRLEPVRSVSFTSRGSIGSSRINKVSLSPDGRRVAVSGGLPVVPVFDVFSFTVAGVLDGHSSDVTQASFSPDGTFIVSLCSDEKSLRIWNSSTFEQTALIDLSLSSSFEFGFYSSGKKIWIRGSEGFGSSTMPDIAVVDVASGKQETLFTLGKSIGVPDLAAEMPVFLHLSYEGFRATLIGSEIASGKELFQQPVGNKDGVFYNIARSPGGKCAAVGSTQGIWFYSLPSGNPIGSVDFGGLAGGKELHFRADGSEVVSGPSNMFLTVTPEQCRSR